jgi:O-antigen/teichoic acid export membrane protein
VLSVVVGFGVNVLLARLLPPEEMGAYFLTFSTVSFLAVISQGGLNQAIVRFVAESMSRGQGQQARAAVKLAFLIVTLTSAAVAGLSAIGPWHWLSSVFGSSAMDGMAGLAAVWVVVMSLQGLQAETFRGFHDIRAATLFGGLISGGLTVIVLGALWITYTGVGLGAVLLVALIAGGASVLVAGIAVRARLKTLPRGGATSVKNVLHVAWPMFVSNLTAFLFTQADLWVLGVFRAEDEVAVYGAAAKVAAFVATPLAIANAVLPPVIAEYFAQGRKDELEQLLRTAATWTTVPAFVVAALFAATGPEVLETVFGPHYRSGAPVLLLLSIGYLIHVSTGSCGYALIMTGHQRVLMWISVCCGLLIPVGGAVVVPEYGAPGIAAIVATVIVFQNALMLFAVRKYLGIWTHMGFNIGRFK